MNSSCITVIDIGANEDYEEHIDEIPKGWLNAGQIAEKYGFRDKCTINRRMKKTDIPHVVIHQYRHYVTYWDGELVDEYMHMSKSKTHHYNY